MKNLIITTLLFVGTVNVMADNSAFVSVPSYASCIETGLSDDDGDPAILQRLKEKYGSAYYFKGYYTIKQNEVSRF